MTDEGMPERIWAIDARKRPDDSPSGVWSERNFSSRACYIRADIADELARHLDDARANILALINSRGSEAEGSDSDWVGDIDDILARYSAATEGK